MKTPAADDFKAIRTRMEELRRERDQPPPAPVAAPKPGEGMCECGQVPFGECYCWMS